MMHEFTGPAMVRYKAGFSPFLQKVCTRKQYFLHFQHPVGRNHEPPTTGDLSHFSIRSMSWSVRITYTHHIGSVSIDSTTVAKRCLYCICAISAMISEVLKKCSIGFPLDYVFSHFIRDRWRDVP